MTIDHIIVGADTLDAGITYVEARLGARPVAGGKHPAWGTHNALLSLGPTTYLEVLAPDPETDSGLAPMGLNAIGDPRVVSFAVSDVDLAALIRRAATAGVDLGAITSGQRVTADGLTLRWQLTDPGADRLGGLIPFAIDWGTTPHPATMLPSTGLTFESVRIEHPHPADLVNVLSAVGLPIEVSTGPTARIVAGISTGTTMVHLV